MRTAGRSILALAATLGLAAFTANAPNAEMAAVSDAADASRPFVVKVHADWCGTCTALNPTWDALRQELGEDARFVVLDVTDQGRLAASTAEAERLGLGAFFAEYKARTGTVGVLRGDDREKVEVLKGVTDTARYAQAVAEARSASGS